MAKTRERPDTELLRKRARAAAVRLFSRYGFEGTSVQAIAEELGISKQALLYHFGSKEGLRDAVLVEMVETWRRLLPRLLSALTRADTPFEEALSEIIAAFREEPAYARFLMQQLLQPRRERHPLVENIESWLDTAAAALRHGQKQKIVDPALDPAAWVVNVGTLILATLSLLDDKPRKGGPRQDEILREMARIVGTSLLAKKTR